jgi:hypothetical protein
MLALTVVHIPRLFLQDDAYLRELPTNTGPGVARRSSKQLHEYLSQMNALARRADSSLRRRFSIVCGYGGGSAYIVPTPNQPP